MAPQVGFWPSQAHAPCTHTHAHAHMHIQGAGKTPMSVRNELNYN